MALIQNISPPPIYDILLEDDGSLTQPWQDWISQLQIILNQVINKINTL
jgi:hypothetical protein